MARLFRIPMADAAAATAHKACRSLASRSTSINSSRFEALPDPSQLRRLPQSRRAQVPVFVLLTGDFERAASTRESNRLPLSPGRKARPSSSSRSCASPESHPSRPCRAVPRRRPPLRLERTLTVRPAQSSLPTSLPSLENPKSRLPRIKMFAIPLALSRQLSRGVAGPFRPRLLTAAPVDALNHRRRRWGYLFDAAN